MQLQAGCAVLVFIDVVALVVLTYLALVAGLLFPMDCATLDDPACVAAHAQGFANFALAFWATIFLNISFVVFALWKRPK